MALFIKPREGMTIIDPVLKSILPAAGRTVEDSPYWRRMIGHGDVIVSEKPKPETVAQKPTPGAQTLKAPEKKTASPSED